MNETSHYLPLLFNLCSSPSLHPSSSFVIFFLPSLNLSSHLPQRDVTGEEEEVKGGAGGQLEQKFTRRKERRKRWDDIFNNVCHGRDVWIGEMWGQLLVCQK